jgi:transcriptional regulator with XRE-family HTH domain
MQADRDTFGPRLRLEREKRGITLKHIAESTKIKESLFAELERGDVSKWPQGIFRRAHLCAYISAIGLPSQPTLNEFLQLFPDEHLTDQNVQNAQNAPLKGSDGSAATDTQPQIAQPAVAVRYDALLDRAWIVLFDLAAICLISSFVAAVSGCNLYLAVALVGLGYFAAGSACYSASIGGYVQHWIHQFVQSRNQFELIQSPLREMRLVRPMPNPDISATREEPEIQQQRASA